MKYMSVVILHIAHMFNFCTQKCTLKIEYGREIFFYYLSERI